MNRSEVVAKAKGDSVTEKRVSRSLIDTLNDAEQPHFIFPIPMGVQIDGTKPSSSLTELKSDSKIIITSQRILLLKESKKGDKKDQIPISNVEHFQGKAGGILTIGNIEIKTQKHIYSGSLHRKIKNSEITKAKNFITNWEADSSATTEGSVGGKDTGSVRAHRVLEQVEITEDYGVGIGQGKYKLEFNREGLHFHNSIANSTRSISIERVDFKNISTTSERDFKKENRSRYINQLNPFLDDASPAKKRNKELVKIPADDGAKYIELLPGRSTSFGEILDGLSGIDPRLDPNRSEDNQGTDQAPNENQSNNKHQSSRGNQSALEILKKRLAKGEISPAEFEERKQYLEPTEGKEPPEKSEEYAGDTEDTSSSEKSEEQKQFIDAAEDTSSPNESEERTQYTIDSDRWTHKVIDHNFNDDPVVEVSDGENSGKFIISENIRTRSKVYEHKYGAAWIKKAKKYLRESFEP